MTTLLGRVGRIALKSIHSRVELLTIEVQEERLHLTQLLVKAMALVFFGILGALLITAAIILIFPEGLRIWVTAALGIIYLVGALIVWSRLRASLSREPFHESIEQVKKDRLWLETLK